MTRNVFLSAVSVLFATLLLCFGISTVAFGADFQAAKSKTATDLNSSKETTVTLSLPSAEYTANTNVDVVLVMDKSAYSDIDGIETAASNLLSSLAESDMDVKLGVVVFDAWGHDAYSLSTGAGDTVTGLVSVTDDNLSALEGAVSYDLSASDYYIGGSNSEQPIRIANDMLAADTDTPASNKYVIVLSDFETYVYEGSLTMDGVTYESAPVGRGGYGYGDETPMCRLDSAGSSDYSSWDELFAAWQDGTIQNTSSYNVNQFFRYGTNGSSWRTYWNNISTSSSEPDADLTASEYTAYFNGEWDATYQSGEKKFYGNDVSLCKTYDALKASHDAGYNIGIFSTSHDGTVSDDNWNQILKYKPMGLIQQLQDDLGAVAYGRTSTNENITNHGTDISTMFEDLESEIRYLVAEATVTDKIGSDFDLVTEGDTSPFSVSVAGEELTATKLSDNEWGYGTPDSSGTYPYVITYDPDEEQFVAQINVPIENSKQVQISYRLKLTADETGTYPTNEFATLDYTDSTGESTGSEDFEIPYVKYTKPAADDDDDAADGNDDESSGSRADDSDKSSAGTDKKKDSDATTVTKVSETTSGETTPETGDDADAGILAAAALAALGSGAVALRARQRARDRR